MGRGHPVLAHGCDCGLFYRYTSATISGTMFMLPSVIATTLFLLHWAWRINVEAKGERNILIGNGENSLKLKEYGYRSPLFFSVGYRF